MNALPLSHASRAFVSHNTKLNNLAKRLWRRSQRYPQKNTRVTHRPVAAILDAMYLLRMSSPASNDLRILFSGTHDPSVIPAPQLSSDQVTTIPRMEHYLPDGPNLDRENRPWISVPAGEYDLADELRKQGIDLNFDLLIVQTDAGRANIPKNLGQFDCRKVLLVGDSHHMESPIRNLLEYALSEDFDCVGSIFDRQHLHWFHEVGFSDLAWIPGLGVEHFPTKPPNRIDPQVCFVGTAGKNTPHLYRSKLLKCLEKEGVPLLQRLQDSQVPRADAANMYRRSAINFNCSLNGDFNLRVFEVLSAGGFLLTDELSNESGLDHAFSVGTDLVTFKDAADLLEKIAYYLDRPAEAAEIAAEGHRTYLSSHLPDMKTQALLDWALKGQLDPMYDPSGDHRFRRPRQSLEAVYKRVMMYETIQEEHQGADSLELLMVGRSALRYADDLSDLPRLQLYWASQEPAAAEVDEAILRRNRVQEISYEESRMRSWDWTLWSGVEREVAQEDETAWPNAVILNHMNEHVERFPPEEDDSPERFLVIRINHSHAGFFAYVNFALNQLTYAEKHNLRPVVYFGPTSEDGPNAFYDAGSGDNTWDYYFEPVAGLTYDDLKARLDDPDDPLHSDAVITLNNDELWEIHCDEPDSVFPYPHSMHKGSYHEDPDWYAKQRARAHRIIQRHVQVQPHIQEKVDAFQDEHFGDRRVLGLHMRGTDKGTADGPTALMRIVRPHEYFSHIDAYTEEHGPCAIFIATDQRQFVDQLKERYGDRVLAYDAVRASGIRNPFEMQDGQGYRKGEDVLIECLLLSRCDYLLKCTSAVGEFAMYFEPGLSCTDLNHTPIGFSPFTTLSMRIKRLLYLRYLDWKARAFRRQEG